MRTDEELRDLLREPHDEVRAHENWDAVARQRRRPPGVPPRSSSRLALAAAGIAIAAAALLVWRGSSAPVPGPLRLEDGTVATGLVERASVTLDDGSRLTVEDGARLEVLENAGDHVRFWLHAGAARFDVVPGGPRRWVIDSGLVTVEVLGTSFRVEHLSNEVRVSVERGSVLVRGPTAPGGMQRLRAGDSIALPLGEALEARQGPATEVAPATEETPASAVSPPQIDVRGAALRPTAAESRAREPAPSVGPEVATDVPAGAGAAAPDRPSALREADALRRAGRLEEALVLLASIVDDPAAGPDRALAAFTLARIELDRRDHPREAAAAFSRAIELGLREPLLEDARARRVQALARLDVAAARAAAAEYLAHHPEGRWRAEVERWADTP